MELSRSLFLRQPTVDAHVQSIAEPLKVKGLSLFMVCVHAQMHAFISILIDNRCCSLDAGELRPAFAQIKNCASFSDLRFP
jgi:hypothetical protein